MDIDLSKKNWCSGTPVFYFIFELLCACRFNIHASTSIKHLYLSLTCGVKYFMNELCTNVEFINLSSTVVCSRLCNE